MQRLTGLDTSFLYLGASLISYLASLEPDAPLPGLIGLVPSFVARSLRGEGMGPPFTAPRASFNRTISGERSVAHVELPLAEVKWAKNAFGTVNDVVLALCTGALRTFLVERG